MSTAQSIRDRLMRRVREEGLVFNQVFTLYTLERLLYRVGASPYSSQFILKGGLMMRATGAPFVRPTRDVDLEGFIDADPTAIARVFQEIARWPCPEDALNFEADQILAEPIQVETEYGGVRVTLPGHFGTARFSVQVDIGFGDKITPGPVSFRYPTWLDHLPPPQVLGYPTETIIAEKYETVFRRREDNSRIKDWFDIWLLATTLSFDGATLQSAIASTFRQRSRNFDENPRSLYASIAETPNRIANWRSFLKMMPEDSAPETLAEVFDLIAKFLDPVMASCSNGRDFHGAWNPQRRNWS